MKFKPPLAGAAAAGCVLAADALIATRLTAAPGRALTLKRGIDRAQLAGMLAMPVSLTGAALGTDAASVAGAAATLTIANRRAATDQKPLAEDKENKA